MGEGHLQSKQWGVEFKSPIHLKSQVWLCAHLIPLLWLAET